MIRFFSTIALLSSLVAFAALGAVGQTPSALNQCKKNSEKALTRKFGSNKILGIRCAGNDTPDTAFNYVTCRGKAKFEDIKAVRVFTIALPSNCSGALNIYRRVL